MGKVKLNTVMGQHTKVILRIICSMGSVRVLIVLKILMLVSL